MADKMAMKLNFCFIGANVVAAWDAWIKYRRNGKTANEKLLAEECIPH